MVFEIMRLEERIVLDAAGGGEIVEAADQHGDDSTSSHEASESHSDDGHTWAVDAVDYDTGVDNIPAEPPSILVVSDSLENADQLT